MEDELGYGLGEGELDGWVESGVKEWGYGLIGLKGVDVGKDVVLDECEGYGWYL